MTDYKYIKFNVDDLKQKMVFFEYLPKSEGNKLPIIERAIPLAKLLDVEQRLETFLEGEVAGIYLEFGPNTHVLEKIYEDRVENTLSDEMLEYVLDLTKRACVDKEFDELLKPPSIDEQVEDFINEFFTDDESENINQEDFLSDFFSELEDDAKNEPLNTTETNQRSLPNEIEKEFNGKKVEARDFLAEFFEEIEEKSSK